MNTSFSTKDIRNLNGTAAGLIARKLDANDGIADGKISGSVWNEFVEKIDIGKQIRKEGSISIVNAMNSITTYFVRKSSQAGFDSNNILNQWFGFAGTSAVGDNVPNLNTLSEADETEENQTPKLKIDISGETEDVQKDILAKYDALASVYGEEIADEKIEYYIKGLQYKSKEATYSELSLLQMQKEAGMDVDEARLQELQQEATPFVIDGVQEALDEQDMNKFIEAFHDAAKNYIALYDDNNDGRIDIKELIKAEEKQLGRTLSPEDMEIVKQEAMNVMAILNQYDNKATGDVNQLDENEIAAYLWAMSKINDGKDGKTAYDITYEEWNTAHTAMGILSGVDMTEEEVELTNAAFVIIGKTNVSIDEIYKMDDLSSLKNITEDERNILEQALPILARNGYNQEMIDNYALMDAALQNGYNGLKREL